MNSQGRLVLFYFCLLPFAFAPKAQAQQSSCAICHSEINVPFQRSAHANAQMTCVSCHGGNSEDMQINAMSPAAGFRGAPSRAQVPEFCASCHEDRMRMRQYGIPTDQFALYQTSIHGQRWAQGDTKVAVCIDCHTSHGVLPPDDPRSTVAPANVPKTCAACHSQEKLMSQYGLASNQFEQYRESVHGNVLLSGSSTAAPSCASCHGSHGALPPGISEIRNVCGQCHRNVEDAMNRGFHRDVKRDGVQIQCTSCHGNHRIVAPTLQLFDTTCEQCHVPGSAPYQDGQRIKATLEHAQALHDQAKKMVDHLAEEGRDTADLAKRLQEAHTHFVETRTASHSLIFSDIERHTVVVEATAEDVMSEVGDLHAIERLRKVSLLVVWGFILWTVLCIYWKIRRVQETQRGREEGPG